MATAGECRSWKVEVCQPKMKNPQEEMINQQSAAIMSTSSTKHHKLICQLRTNTRPLGLDRQTVPATESGITATTKHAILLSTYHHLRVRSSTAGGGTCTIQPSRPRGRSHSMLLCAISRRINRDHFYLLLVLLCVRLPHLCPCMYVYLPKLNKQMHYYDPYRSTNGILFRVTLLYFWGHNMIPTWK